MTTIRIWRDKQGHVSRIQASGHSDYAEEGSDIVCASVSVLMTTCANALQSVADCIPTVSVDETRGIMDLFVSNPENETVQTIVKTILQGLSDVSEAYPKYVQIK